MIEKVCIIILDGDSQFFTQIDNAIRPYFKNVKRMPCGWYLIHKGWEWHVDNASQFNNVSMTEYWDIKQTLTSWMVSWMKGVCETRQEYKFSLYLITKYLKSSPIIHKYGTLFSMSVLMFIRKHVIQQEEWYAFYNHKDLHHNEEFSNTPLEGTNNAIKHSSSSTYPQMSMSNAMRILCEQSTPKMAIKRANHQVKMDKFSTNYESKPIHDRITLFASSKIWGLFKFSKNLKCKKKIALCSIYVDIWICYVSSFSKEGQPFIYHKFLIFD